MNQIGVTCFSQANGDCRSILLNRLFQIKRHHLPNAVLERPGLRLDGRMGLITDVDDLVGRALRQFVDGPPAFLGGFYENASDIYRQ